MEVRRRRREIRLANERPCQVEEEQKGEAR